MTGLKEGVAFTDYFCLEDIQKVQDEFARATGVASIITTPDGVPITDPSNYCRLCREVIRNTNEGMNHCHQADVNVDSSGRQEPAISHCGSGVLWDAGVGIVVDGRHIANWRIGQVRDAQQRYDGIPGCAEEIGIDEGVALRFFDEIPVMSSEKFGSIVGMLNTLANQISAAALQDVKQSRLICKLEQTERNLLRNEKELLASEYRLRVVVDNLPDAMIFQIALHTDGSRHFIYVNGNVSKLHEVSAEEVLKDSGVLYRQVHHDDLEQLVEAEAKAVRTMSMFRCEIRFVLPGGRCRWRLISASPRILESGVVVWDGIEIDITDRREAEAEQEKLESMLRQTQKMEAIGQLAGGIAHDLNNMLSPIIGYAELLLMDKREGRDSEQAINSILSAGFMARDLVQRLLVFSRKQTLKFENADLNTVLGNFERLIRRTLREDITLEIKKFPGLLSVQADTNQLEQVIMNLVVNGQDAMPQGGLLEIETSLEVVTAHHYDLLLEVPVGSYVKLQVKDSGTGISPDVREKIFEPFFSTKGSRGTGLGLATVYGIIVQHKGTISLKTEPGKGTTLAIYLPVSEDAEIAQVSDDQEFSRLTGNETVLLVEDDHQVLEMTKTVLKQKGYSVLTANNGERGLQIIREYPREIHLLLTDVIMPAMNGRELYEEARRLKPDLKVIFVSGYSDDVISHRGIVDDGTNFIQKPFALSCLYRQIRSVLDG